MFAYCMQPVLTPATSLVQSVATAAPFATRCCFPDSSTSPPTSHSRAAHCLSHHVYDQVLDTTSFLFTRHARYRVTRFFHDEVSVQHKRVSKPLASKSQLCGAQSH